MRGGSRQSICQPALHLSQRSSLSQTASDGKKTNAPITPIRPLPGDSAPLGVINTAASRGGNESHSRGEGDPVHNDKSPLKKKKPEGEIVWVEVPSSPNGEPRYQPWAQSD